MYTKIAKHKYKLYDGDELVEVCFSRREAHFHKNLYAKYALTIPKIVKEKCTAVVTVFDWKHLTNRILYGII